jgi:putative membrane protein
VPAPHQPNTADQVFVIRATLGGAAEIELARLAEQTTRNDGVREFARHMFRDHSQADNSLSRLAERDGISVPEEIDAKHQHVRDGLSRPVPNSTSNTCACKCRIISAWRN